MSKCPAPLALTLCVGLAALAACSGGGGSGNPDVLWLALDGTETQVRLVASEPTPF